MTDRSSDQELRCAVGATVLTLALLALVGVVPWTASAGGITALVLVHRVLMTLRRQHRRKEMING